MGVTARALAGSIFVVLTAPVAAHMIGRAAYAMGVPLWEGTGLDELKEHKEAQAAAEEPEPESAPELSQHEAEPR